MTRYVIAFDATEFSVSTDSELSLGYEAHLDHITVAGVGNMAISVEVSSPAFRVRLVVRGRSERELPVPDGTPAPIWTGVDTTLATVVVDAGSWSVLVTPRDVAGVFNLRARIDGVPWGTEVTEEVTLTAEQPDHLDLVQAPV